MSGAGELAWQRYVKEIGGDVRALLREVESGQGGARAALGLAFRMGLSSLLVGAEDVARLALAIETTLAAGAPLTPLLREAIDTLHAAVVQLENADKSGARVEGLPLTELTAHLLNRPSSPSSAPFSPSPSPSVASPSPSLASPSPSPSPSFASPSPSPSGFSWSPQVDEDMIELFFEEAGERIEGISGKLLEIERRAGDLELLRELFRDLHTVKGSSAMVGLEPVNRLAHAAEDLVGQLREETRQVDANVVSALLATLDGLRRMLDAARARTPIHADPELLRALRDPASGIPQPVTAARPATAASPAAASESPAHDATPPSVATSAPGAQAARPTAEPAGARQTIRVDFDKLDRLLNLVGELVLGRDGLRSANSALASVSAELSADRALAKRLTKNARHLPSGRSSSDGRHASKQEHDLVAELGRIERVLGSVASDLDGSTSHLESISSELREQVMRLRMVPVGGVLRKHQRTVRDLGISLGKRVHLDLVGEDTELDKLLVEALDEPLLHLVRNAVDHGVETPEARALAGKPADAVVTLSAFHRGNQVLIQLRDDGRGMDPQKLRQKAVEKGVISEAEAAVLDDRGAYELIFRAGFSTASVVSDVSGRGVGMDVVRQTIVTRLKGSIEVESQLGHGSSFTLRLPLTLAIIQVLLATVATETFAIPLDGVTRTVAIPPSDVRWVGDREVIELDGQTLPLIRLSSVLELDAQPPDEGASIMVVVSEHAGESFGIACDRLLGRKEIVIKSLGEILAGVPCVSGATILGDRCALILDVPAVVQRALRRPSLPRREPPKTAQKRGASILLVDDSDLVRESLRRLLSDAGYEVTTAEDGREALELCQTRRFDLVSTDVMMPRMDGYELTRALRAMPTYHETPIVMVTSRGERIDRVRGFDAGVDDYIEKPHDRQLLLRSVKKLLGHDKGAP